MKGLKTSSPEVLNSLFEDIYLSIDNERGLESFEVSWLID